MWIHRHTNTEMDTQAETWKDGQADSSVSLKIFV